MGFISLLGCGIGPLLAALLIAKPGRHSHDLALSVWFGIIAFQLGFYAWALTAQHTIPRIIQVLGGSTLLLNGPFQLYYVAAATGKVRRSTGLTFLLLVPFAAFFVFLSAIAMDIVDGMALTIVGGVVAIQQMRPGFLSVAVSLTVLAHSAYPIVCLWFLNTSRAEREKFASTLEDTDLRWVRQWLYISTPPPGDSPTSTRLISGHTLSLTSRFPCSTFDLRASTIRSGRRRTVHVIYRDHK